MSSDEYGIVIAQSGTPVARASDYQRILDTRWKTMSIVDTKKVSFSDVFALSSNVVKILDHNLGYIPAFEAPFYNTRYESGVSNSGNILWLADKTSIYLVTSDSVQPLGAYTIDGYVTDYDLNIEEDYQGKDRGLIGSTSRSDRGVKIIGNDQYAAHDASDSNPLGFSLTTDSKAIGVDRVATVQITGGDSVGFTVLGRGVIQHTLNYPPLVKTSRLYSNSNGVITTDFINFPAPSNELSFYTNLGLTRAKVEPQKIVLESYRDDIYRYILFKEPTEIAG